MSRFEEYLEAVRNVIEEDFENIDESAKLDMKKEDGFIYITNKAGEFKKIEYNGKVLKSNSEEGQRFLFLLKQKDLVRTTRNKREALVINSIRKVSTTVYYIMK